MKQLYRDLWQSMIYDAGAYLSHAYLPAQPDGNAAVDIEFDSSDCKVGEWTQAIDDVIEWLARAH